MRTMACRSLASSVLFALACSEDLEDPWAEGGSTMSTSASATTDDGAVTSTDDGVGEGPSEDGDAGTSGAATTDDGGETEPAGSSETGDETTDAAGDETTGDDDTGGTTDGGAIDCVDLGACQPCVDCTVAPRGPCLDEALACEGDPDCNVLANCYNGCAMQFMGTELMTCVQGCYDEHPDSVATFQAAYGCFLDACSTLCM